MRYTHKYQKDAHAARRATAAVGRSAALDERLHAQAAALLPASRLAVEQDAPSPLDGTLSKLRGV